ncbi:MAG: hypothetical protein AAGF12_19995 [Myxococcota bacterium]
MPYRGWLVVGWGFVMSGCYLSHERPEDVEAEVCEVRHLGVETVVCEIDVNEADSCGALGRCLCENGALPARGNAIGVEACLQIWILPRAQVTLSDFCQRTVDGVSLGDAARGFYDEVVMDAEVEISPRCDTLLAVGPGDG